MNDPERPTPEQMLARIRSDSANVESASSEGKLRLFFGYAAGVGKTYAMLQTAYQAVERIMALAKSLGGVISGEHGIGITKLEFLSDEELAGAVLGTAVTILMFQVLA